VRHHDLKIWPRYFARVADGTKTFEVRKNDRDFQAGDSVRLHEYDHDREGGGGYTGASLSFRIGYVLPIDDGDRVVFSILPTGAP
jgi:hypothetical protein